VVASRGLRCTSAADSTRWPRSQRNAELRLSLTVKGEQRQDVLLGDLLFDVPSLIADISRIVALRPGDIIATGTPGGVVAGMRDPRWLAEGDVVETSNEGIGALRNTIIAGDNAPSRVRAQGSIAEN